MNEAIIALTDEELDRRLALAHYDFYHLRHEWQRRLSERNLSLKRSELGSEIPSVES